MDAKHFKTIQNTTSAASRKMRSMTGFHYKKYKIFQNTQFQTKMNATTDLGHQMVPSLLLSFSILKSL